MKNVKKMVTALLLLFVAGAIVYAFLGGSRKTASSLPGKTEPVSYSGYVLYYFHGDVRCPTCMRMEKYSKESVEQNFSELLSKGTLSFKIFNIDKPEHSHYREEFNLSFKTAIVAEYKDGKVVRFQNLDRIWELNNDRTSFVLYMTDEITGFMKGEAK